MPKHGNLSGYRRNRYHLRKTAEPAKDLEEVDVGAEYEDPKENEGTIEVPLVSASKLTTIEARMPNPEKPQSEISQPVQPQRESRPPAYFADFALG